jgi:hypothetical protein
MDIGIKVSLPGYEVKDATPEQCAINSEYDHLRVLMYNDTEIEYAPLVDPDYGVWNILTIPHGQNYIPDSICNVEISGYSPYITSCPFFFGELGEDIQCIRAFCNDTNFIIEYVREAGGSPGHLSIAGSSFPFKYQVFVQGY